MCEIITLSLNIIITITKLVDDVATISGNCCLMRRWPKPKKFSKFFCPQMRYSCPEMIFWCVKSYAGQSKVGWFSLCWFLQQQSLSLPKCDKDLGNFDKLTNFSAATERSSTSYLGFLRLCNFLVFCHKSLIQMFPVHLNICSSI